MPPNVPRLIVEVFQREWYGGRRGIVLESIPDTRDIGFRNSISSLRIYKGPGYGSGSNLKAIFYEEPNYEGRRLVLGPGYYHSLRQIAYNFDNRISSIRFGSESRVDGPAWGTVPVIVDLFEKPDFQGNRTTIVRDEVRLTTRVSNAVGSIRLYKGPDCPPMGCRVLLFEAPEYEGVPYPLELTRQDAIVELPDIRLLPQPLPPVIGSVKIEGWAASTEFTLVVFQDEFDGTRLKDQWEWVDPREGGHWRERQGWLLMRVEPGQDLWRGANYDAPRILRSESGDFAIETRIQITRETNPHGGLLVWFDENAFVRLEKTSPRHAFRGDIRFEQHTEREEEPLVGRGMGLRDATQLYLRIEWIGNLFHGYASANAVDWVNCGTAFVPMGDPVKVGLHALCPGNMPETLTRFDYFKILKRPTEAPLRSARRPAPYRSPERAQRIDAVRKLT